MSPNIDPFDKYFTDVPEKENGRPQTPNRNFPTVAKNPNPILQIPEGSVVQQQDQQIQQVEEQDPFDQYFSEQEDQGYSDRVAQEQQRMGYDPNAGYRNPEIWDDGNEFERAADWGNAQATKGFLSGATLGASEKVPGLKPEKNLASAGGEVLGSFIPIEGLGVPLAAAGKLFSGPVVRLAQKSPVMANWLKSGASLVSTGIQGGTYGAATEAIKKEQMPSTEEFLTHGALWAGLHAALGAAGAGLKFGKELFRTAEQTKTPVFKVLNKTLDELVAEGVDFTNAEQVAAKATEAVEALNPGGRIVKQPQKELFEGLEKRVTELKNTKVSPNTLKPLTGKEAELAQPYLPGQYTFETVAKDANNAYANELIETIGERAPTQKQLGENIKASVETAIKNSEAEYKAGYNLVNESTNTAIVNTPKTGKSGANILKENLGYNLEPSAHKQVNDTVRDALEDLGWTLVKDKNGKFENLVHNKEVDANTVRQVLDRLRYKINYEAETKSVKDALKSFRQVLKEDYKDVLSKDARSLFEETEKKFGEQAEKFNTDAMRKIRKAEAGENIAKLIKSPTALSEIKGAVSERVYQQVEREVLEHINSLPEEKARALYRELSPQLSLDAQLVGAEVVESKVAPSLTKSEKQIQKVQDKVLDEIGKSSLTGERPKYSLEMWKDKKGQQVIKHALKDNPNRKEILEYLETQSFNDFASSFVGKDGSVNWKKFNELVKDPATIENIRLIGGDEAVTFFRRLEDTSKKINDNIANIEKLGESKQEISNAILGKKSAAGRKELNELAAQRGEQKLKESIKKKHPWQVRFNEVFKNLSPETKQFLKYTGWWKPNIASGIYGGYKVLNYMATNPRLRRAMLEASASKSDPKALFFALENIDKILKSSKESD